jgi:hypothetical protein
VTLPKLRCMARHALPHLFEATLIPLGLFYVFLALVDLHGAILASLVWSYGALARRLVRRERVPGLLLLGSVGLTFRTLVAIFNGSVFFYFLQPSLTAVAIGGIFLFSIPAGCPLAERLVGDLVPLPPALMARPAIRRVFVRITLLWSFANVLNAALTIGLLLSQPVAVFVVAKTIMSMSLTGCALAVSARWFLRTARQPVRAAADETEVVGLVVVPAYAVMPAPAVMPVAAFAA